MGRVKKSLEGNTREKMPVTNVPTGGKGGRTDFESRKTVKGKPATRNKKQPSSNREIPRLKEGIN